MDFQQLRVFRSAARNAGFTRASDELHLSQSTVSQHIRQLEEELGCPLFLRVGKHVLISEAGKLLLQYTERIFRDLKNAEMAVRELNSMKRGTVRLGVGATTLTYRLAPVLGEYKRRFPDIELIVVTGTTELLMAAVKSQQVDLAILMCNSAPPGIALRRLGQEELVCVLNHEHPLARKKVLEASDLAELRFILYEKNTAMQNLIDGYFEQMGISPHVAMELENTEAIKSLLRAGLGASILPLCAVADTTHTVDLRVIRIRGFKLVRELALASVDAEFLPNAISELGSLLEQGLNPKGRPRGTPDQR